MIDPEATPCSEASAQIGEPLPGSASEAPLFAAIAWPKALWHHDRAALSEGLPAAVAELERAGKAAGRKLQLRLFERAERRADSRVEVVCVDFASAETLACVAPEAQGAAEAVARFVAGARSGPRLAAPLVLVCTDGRHDRCCGKLGRSLVSALRGAVDVAEASHLGGHRLAANCLVLPSGRLYGRVTPADVPALLEAVRRDSVYLPCYRGQSGLGELEQVAEAAALARQPRARALRFAVERLADGEARVAVTGAGVRLDVTCARRIFSAIASCGDAAPERRERWVAVSALPAAAAP